MTVRIFETESPEFPLLLHPDGVIASVYGTTGTRDSPVALQSYKREHVP